VAQLWIVSSEPAEDIMRTKAGDLTEGLSSGRRQTRLGLTGVEADASPRRREKKYPESFFLRNSRQSHGKVLTLAGGIGSNTSLKQNALVCQTELEHPSVTFCLAQVR